MVVAYLKGVNMLRLSYSSRKEEGVKELQLHSIGEFLSLYRATEWYRSETGSDDLYTPYTGKAKEAFDTIVRRYVKKTKATTVDFSKKFITSMEGTSKLIYQPGKGTIHLALRRSRDNYTSMNSLCISNEVRDAFIEDCKTVDKKRFMLSKLCEPELFDKWVRIIQAEYIKQYLKEKV